MIFASVYPEMLFLYLSIISVDVGIKQTVCICMAFPNTRFSYFEFQVYPGTALQISLDLCNDCDRYEAAAYAIQIASRSLFVAFFFQSRLWIYRRAVEWFISRRRIEFLIFSSGERRTGTRGWLLVTLGRPSSRGWGEASFACETSENARRDFGLTRFNSFTQLRGHLRVLCSTALSVSSFSKHNNDSGPPFWRRASDVWTADWVTKAKNLLANVFRITGFLDFLKNAPGVGYFQLAKVHGDAYMPNWSLQKGTAGPEIYLWCFEPET